ncbi:hypothetical protein BpHYR1_003572 [Brachionus plicatilis]|uniref:Uncharacterized protein n=1 Tax=Brachionus plicatilis TaxID=10195 RepID=A0A3M7Q2Y0_BRAPC|nr:hypothetical protein BpHYR1_003572 [Brachionus plicatilis]
MSGTLIDLFTMLLPLVSCTVELFRDVSSCMLLELEFGVECLPFLNNLNTNISTVIMPIKQAVSLGMLAATA